MRHDNPNRDSGWFAREKTKQELSLISSIFLEGLDQEKTRKFEASPKKRKELLVIW